MQAGRVPGKKNIRRKRGKKMGFVKALPKTVISVAAALVIINMVKPYLPEQVSGLLG